MTKKRASLTDILSLEQVLQTIPSALFLVDRQQRIVYWNAEAERITGFPAAEVLGRPCSFLEGIPCGEGCGLFETRIPKPIIGATCSIRTRDGRRLTLAKNIDYLRDARGEIVGGIESFIDISRRVELESRLRRQTEELEQAVADRTAELAKEQNRLRTVLDAMSDFAYITAADYRIVFMNRAMTELFGSQLGELCYRMFRGQEDPCPSCPLEDVLAGRPRRQERRLERNGRTYEILNTPLRTTLGEVQKLAVFRDVTERIAAEEQLREANRELDAFVYTVSHDLRTPLTPIIGFAEFLRTQYAACMDQRAATMLGEIEEQGERMLALLEDLLTLARLGSVAPPAKSTDCVAVVRRVASELAEPLARQGTQLRIGPLPALRIPETLLSQVFANLLGNAVRYAGAAEEPIEVGGARRGGRVHFYVRDHGRGLPAAERQRVFDAFYRGTATRQTPGTGIGLAIVRKIARLYGGRAWVEETPGGGCTFRVELLELPLEEDP